MKNIKEIRICFENCEVVTLEPNMFKYLIINGIKKNIDINCYQYEKGETNENLQCEYFGIEINQIGLEQECWGKEKLKTRLNRNDIVSVILVFENEEKDIYVEWCEDNDYTNEYQMNKQYEDKINIVIQKM